MIRKWVWLLQRCCLLLLVKYELSLVKSWQSVASTCSVAGLLYML